MAGDRQATHSSGLKFKIKTKIFKFSNKLLYPRDFIVGYSGSLSVVGDVLAFLADDQGQTKMPKIKGEAEFLVLTEDKQIFTFFNVSSWILLDEPHYSIGSGSHIAMGALKAGASPKDAVKAASECDPSTGMGVKVVNFK